MAQAKMMNENIFEKLVKEINSQGELIRTRQDEKQSVMNEFDREKGRYTTGKISRATLTSSVVKTNKELVKLDSNIRVAIRKAETLSNKMDEALTRQEPKVFRASESGLRLNEAKKKSPAKKKVAISKTTLSREKTIDRKYSKK